ncbi:hypothetical protein HDU98_002852 [Podochytrium sp. JEL0797]|nr:hypothetical protein HDU98_002852 [Podochytrium sp. JEL0797]
MTPGPEFDLPLGPLESLPYCDLESRETLVLLLETITTPEFWTTLARYHAQESSKGSEHFNPELFNLVHVLAGQFEDLFVVQLQRIVMELVQDGKDKSKQRAASELLAGLVRGSKNWSTVKLDKMWAWVMPVLENAFQSCSTETMRFWIQFLNQVFANRDPRRVLPIIQFIFNWKLDPTAQSFFTESKKLTLLKVTISSFKWRLASLYPALLSELFTHLRNPYQQVRDILGVVIDKVMQCLWHPSADSVTQVVEWNIKSRGGLAADVFEAGGKYKGVIPVVPDAAVAGLVETLFRNLDVWREVPRTSNVGPSDYGNASKSIIAWVVHSLTRNGTTSKYTCMNLLVPEFFKMMEFDDADLQTTAKAITTIYSHSPFPLHYVPRVMHQLLAILEEPDLKWQVKLKLLPILQVLFFRNLLFLTSPLKHLVLETVSEMLEDPQLEVRNLAGVTLSGLVRCSERDSISSLKAKFEASLKLTKAAKKKLTLPPRTDGYESPAIGSGAARSLHPLVVARHAAVIGLSSLVLAFPYDVPEWMPEVLITLSGCISDQAPVATTVSKTFADFRRTHQDTKEEGMKAFTEDQLSILSDLLISSSYYAFLNAVSDAAAKVGNFPFTTIKPNHGIAYVPLPCPCARFGKQSLCSPKHGQCIQGTRMVPLHIMDVAGLVPGASTGEGLGNQFLDDLRHADLLIHVVDSSGTTDAAGKVTIGYDPVNDIEWLRSEIHAWIFNNLWKRWDGIARRHVATASSVAETLALQVSGYGANLVCVQKTLDRWSSRPGSRSSESLESWDQQAVADFVDAFLDQRFPTVIALNKIDLPDSDKNIDKICRKYDSSKIVLTSAIAEQFLRKLQSQGFINYREGTEFFDVADETNNLKPLPPTTLARLEKVQDLVLFRYGHTGVTAVLQLAVETLELIPVYPVRNINTFGEGGAGTGGGGAKGVFRDCMLVRKGTRVADVMSELLGESRKFCQYVETVGGVRLGELDEITKENNILSFKMAAVEGGGKKE